MIRVHIVKGVDSHDTHILEVFFDHDDAEEWMNNYDGDDDFAYLCIDTRNVKGDVNEIFRTN